MILRGQSRLKDERRAYPPGGQTPSLGPIRGITPPSCDEPEENRDSILGQGTPPVSGDAIRTEGGRGEWTRRNNGTCKPCKRHDETENGR